MKHTNPQSFIVPTPKYTVYIFHKYYACKKYVFVFQAFMSVQHVLMRTLTLFSIPNESVVGSQGTPHHPS